MVSLTRSEAVIQLGKRLAKQLDASDDLLASWMAHDIAQKIEDARTASSREKQEAHNVCARAIFELWEHRSAIPKHLQPLRELDPIVRTIASMDLDQAGYRYYPEVLRRAATAEADEATKKWLELAMGLDYSARVLISFALRSAAQSSISDAEAWVELAREAGADEGYESPVVRFIRDNDLSGEKPDETEKWEERLSRLEGFAELSSSLANELREELGVKKNEDS